MFASILAPGEKIHVIHRRHFDHEPHRHFVGVVNDYREGVLRMTGHVYAVDPTTYQFIRRPEQRTRVVSVVSGEVIVNIIPTSVDLSKITYRQEGTAVRVSDGSEWHLDISEVGWRRGAPRDGSCARREALRGSAFALRAGFFGVCFQCSLRTHPAPPAYFLLRMGPALAGKL